MFKLLSIYIFLNYLILQIVCANAQDVDQLSIEDIDYLFNLSQNFGSFDTNSLQQKSDSPKQDSHYCTSHQLLDKFLVSLTPDDFEEGQDLFKKNSSSKVKHINETLEKVDRLQNWGLNLSKTYQPILNRLQMRITEQLMLIDLSQQCLNSLVRIAQAIKNNERWALRFVDALPSTSELYGDYDQCLRIESPETEEDLPVIKGKYCSLSYAQLMPSWKDYQKNRINQSVVDRLNYLMLQMMRKNESNKSGGRAANFEITKTIIENLIYANEWAQPFLKLPIAICLPTTCSTKDIEIAVNKVLYPIIRFPLLINPDCDYVDKPIKINSYQWTAIGIFGTLIFLVLISTLYDCYKKLFTNEEKVSSKDTLISQICQSFSAISNFKNIFWYKRVNNRFNVLDGIRTILCFVTVLSHELMTSFLPLQVKGNFGHDKFLGSRNYMLFKNYHIVDTFFFISGMMTCYVMLSKLSKSKGRFNYFQYSLFRYLRIVVPTMGAVLLIFLYPLSGDGPFWQLTNSILYIPCRDNWLPSLLMTSNFDISFPDRFLCNVGNWSTSADFHLYLLAPIVFLVFYYWPKIGLAWNIFLIGLGAFIAVAPKIIWDLPYFLEFTKLESLWTFTNLFKIYYWRSDPHFVSYVFGILCGYLIREKPKLYFGGRIGELFLWITSFGLTFYLIWWLSDILNPYYPLNRTEVILFLTFSKLMYLSGWFWLLYACATGRGGIVNRFLGWNGFKGTSILAYEVAILHTLVIFYRAGVARERVTYSGYYVWTVTCFDYFATFLISIVFYIILTAPATNLINILIKKKFS